MMRTAVWGHGLALAIIVLVGGLAVPNLAAAGPVQKSAPRNQAEAAAESKYIGPGSCSASACHGSIQPLSATRIRQDEYSTWVTKDKHARAFAVLSDPVSLRIARSLGLGRADTASRCLACHALDVPVGQKGRQFDLTDGVSCESCHGPASAWLGPHTTRDWPHEKSVQLGMYDTRDLVRGSEKCLTCHLGTAQKFVDHELIAAGHPDLVFELDSFQAVMPKHWKEVESKRSWRGVQTWAVGQAVQMREALRRVARRAQGRIWPEYAELDCFACHHRLTRPEQSWRQELGFKGRRPGNPPWNIAGYAVFRHLAGEVNPDAQQRLEAEMSRLHALMSSLNGDRQEIAAAAGRAAELADALVKQITARTFDEGLTLRLLRRITGDADHLAVEGERPAEQATMALDSLFIDYARNSGTPNQQELRTAINDLYRELEDPSAYDARRFADKMKKIGGLLH